MTPLIVPWVTADVRLAVGVHRDGRLGFVWLRLVALTRAGVTPAVSPRELALIRSDPRIRRPRAWCRCFRSARRGPSRSAKFLTDPVWWFTCSGFQTSGPHYGIALSSDRPLLVLIYLIADSAASAAAGSPRLIKRGWTVNAGAQDRDAGLRSGGDPDRRGPYATDLWVVVAWSALAAAAHQGWSANLFTLASDMFPR